jgi:hypothetical protein
MVKRNFHRRAAREKSLKCRMCALPRVSCGPRRGDCEYAIENAGRIS